MELGPIDSLDKYIAGVNSLAMHEKLSSESKDGELEFEQMLNSVLSKELLKPLLDTSMFSMHGQFGYLIENTLADYFSKNLKFMQVSVGDGFYDK